ncbi:arabinosyltransferase domain-containing protein [Saccharopolyspora mangrovi]|uniref:Arabinosyltransferase domain-containing protein n=1 Tax=Saccharopolyspora mangrovi TaxID=3082379 RepID=A0ABU6AD57_9PSEU|nr:arabinosyltransferase domain-containing protein [Saccharopolyspora sp. S2-29]MEB3369487.1 arabinosyltransferase domain-containing protein [Saccharopolyspora sp. S2-29]
MKHLTSTAPVEAPAEPHLDEGPRRPGLERWLAHVIALCLGVAGLCCALALPLAPVLLDRTEVHWPVATDENPTTTAFLTPYRPAEFTATVPCATMRAALARPEPTTVLSTLPPGSDREGMVLSTQDGKPRLLLGEREVRLPDGSCGLTVRGDDVNSQVQPAGSAPIALPGVPAPEVFTFATALEPEQLRGFSVTARTYSWADTAPTETKRNLIEASLLLAACSLLLLFAHTPPVLRDFRVRPLLWPVDAGVAAVIWTWLFVGPLTDDDGFAMMTVRNYAESGDVGNYYRWFNASEAPFTLVQHFMRWWSADGLEPFWLRMPSAIAGLLTWLVVSRGIVAPICRGSRRLPLHLVTAVFFLACWLPYGLGVRPEPFLALGTSVLVASLLRAWRSSAPFGWLGVAALTCGLTVSITPTGVSAALMVLVFAPRIWSVLVRPGALPRWALVPVRLALLASLGSVGLVTMFADSSWNGVRGATGVHDEFGPSLGWYQEIDRYSKLLGTTMWGTAGKRLVVFLVVTAVLISAGCAMRRLHRATGVQDLAVLLGSVVSVLAALWLTPSKWTHHFGALIGVGPALVAVTAVLLLRVGKLAEARREARLLGVFGTVAASVAAGLAFMGPNAWPWQSNLAMPWSDTPVQPDLPLDNPVFWMLAGLLVGLVTLVGLLIRMRLRSRPLGGLMWTVAPASVLAGSALAMALVLLSSFLSVPETMGDRFSVARMNRLSHEASSCGLEDEVQAMPIAEPLAPVDPDDTGRLDGFTAGGTPPQEPDLRLEAPGEQLRRPEPTDPDDPRADEPTARSASEYAWTSQDGGPQNTGTLITPWFGLPRVSAEQTLSLWVSGRPEQGNSLVLEFAAGQRPAGRTELRDPPPTDLPFEDPRHGREEDWRDFTGWRSMTVEPGDIPAGADRVRVLATDRSTDRQGWLTFSGPVVRDVVGLRQALDAQGPLLIDWPMTFVFPCRSDYPQVGHGVAASPRMLITPPEGEYSMATDPNLGGVFAGVPMLSRRMELPTRLRGAPGYDWGHLQVVRYERESDSYTTTRQRERVGGADGDGSYPFEQE